MKTPKSFKELLQKSIQGSTTQNIGFTEEIRFTENIEFIEKYNHRHDERGRFAPKGYMGGSRGTLSSQVQAATRKVKSQCGTKANPIKREGPDYDKIARESGCDRATAIKAADEAKAVFDRMSKAEPQITKDVISVVKSNGGKMYGLDFRMKQETSLARKIATDALDPKEKFNGDLKKAASNVKDACRYTAVFKTEDFTQGYLNVKASLESLGYEEVRCKNFFKDYKEGKSCQKAVQCVYKDKNGNLFEFQFHTYESQGAKELNHPIYEKSRAATATKKQKKQYNDDMTKNSSNAPTPKGALDIKAYKKKGY